MLSKEKKLDPRIIRTRRDLAASMCTLLRQKTFSQVTVQEITEQAIINRATFYAHFEDKFSLLEYMVQDSFQKMLDSKIASCEDFCEENLRLLTLATCEFLAQFDDKYAPRHGNDHPPIERQIQPYIYRLLLNWLAASGIEDSAETIAMSTSWTIFGTALQWSRGERAISAEAITSQIMSFMMQGLMPIVQNKHDLATSSHG